MIDLINNVNGCNGSSHLFHARLVWIPFTLGNVLIHVNTPAMALCLLTQYLVYMVYTPSRHGITAHV